MELTFGEKLVIARKQLDLYQYQMAERLGVHPNSIWKYERGEGKPHAAVLRMFDLLCEKEGIRFDEYESAQGAQGEAMKIVLAEKVSPATVSVFDVTSLPPGPLTVTNLSLLGDSTLNVPSGVTPGRTWFLYPERKICESEMLQSLAV